MGIFAESRGVDPRKRRGALQAALAAASASRNVGAAHAPRVPHIAPRQCALSDAHCAEGFEEYLH